MAKYKNTVVKTSAGLRFDSKKESERYLVLRMAERAGKISDLKTQVKYVLIPAQKDENGKTLERECAYYADFVYTRNGETVVEDVKGMRTDVYRIKKKMMLYFHNIRIVEV